MKIMIIFSVFICACVTYIILILIKEQRSEDSKLKNIQEKNENLKLPQKSDIDTIKPTEELTSQLDELKEKNEELEKLLTAKNQILEQSQGSFNNGLKSLLDHTKIKEIMTQDVTSININTPFSNVPKIFKELAIRHLPVIDADGRLIGLMTQRDMYKIQSPRKLMDGTWHYDEEMLNNVILEHVMVKDPFSLHEENCMGDAVKTMFHSKYGCIPIVDQEHKLCGIITTHDILNLAAKVYLVKK